MGFESLKLWFLSENLQNKSKYREPKNYANWLFYYFNHALTFLCSYVDTYWIPPMSHSLIKPCNYLRFLGYIYMEGYIALSKENAKRYAIGLYLSNKGKYVNLRLRRYRIHSFVCFNVPQVLERQLNWMRLENQVVWKKLLVVSFLYWHDVCVCGLLVY